MTDSPPDMPGDEAPHEGAEAGAGATCPRCGAPTVAGEKAGRSDVWRCTACGLEMASPP